MAVTFRDSFGLVMAMHESVQPHLDDIVSELMGMSLDLLPESEIEKFYRDSLNNCKAGAARS